MDTMELLAHPVRLRVVHALRGGRLLTTSQLCERITDVSKATLYRHIDLLATEGVLEVADERRVRGAVERHYRLRQDLTVIDTAVLESLTPDDHRRSFATAMAILLAEFNAYLNRDHADPAADLVGYRQHALWLSEEELHELISELRSAIAPRLSNQHAPERTQYLLSPVLFPLEAPSPPLHVDSATSAGDIDADTKADNDNQGLSHGEADDGVTDHKGTGSSRTRL